MHDHRVKLRNPYARERTESQSILTMSKAGFTIDEIVDKVAGEHEHGRLIVEYVLGKRELGDIEHLITPYKPTSLEFIRPVDDGYLCEAKGSSPKAAFLVLMETPQISSDRAKEVLDTHGEELAFIAYKNAHERYPAEYERGSWAKAKIAYEDVSHILAG